MKLLLDENLSSRLVPFLQHDYPGSNQVVLLGMQSTSDKELWQKAKDDDFVIVTRDADFQELSLVWGSHQRSFASRRSTRHVPPLSSY